MLQMRMPVKHASRRKIPNNQPFPAGPFFDLAPSPTSIPLHPTLLGFILENAYLKNKILRQWGEMGSLKHANVVEGNRMKIMSNWKSHLELPTEL